uniref:Uncharacterized protein n=1 Tax=Rhizophora mucronata TaxID=61149 RepID=A0A2P2QQQ9_RHIMU
MTFRSQQCNLIITKTCPLEAIIILKQITFLQTSFSKRKLNLTISKSTNTGCFHKLVQVLEVFLQEISEWTIPQNILSPQ